MVNMGEIFAYDRINNPKMELVEMNDKELGSFSLKRGDLLFARQSLVVEGAGKCSIVLEVPETTTFESHLIRVRLDPTKVDSKFYYYYFQSYVGKGKIRSLVNQVAAAGIRGSELAKLPIHYLPLEQQRKIADILSAYDDLIENNTRRVELLEGMARALYREWFVEFRFPGHGALEGGVPQGWTAGRLGDYCFEIRRGVKPNEVDPETPYVGLEHIPRRSLALSEWGRAADVQSTKLRFNAGEILFGKIRPYFHKVAVAPVSGVCSTDAIVIVPRAERWFSLVLACVSSDEFVAHSVQTSNGTKMKLQEF